MVGNYPENKGKACQTKKLWFLNEFLLSLLKEMYEEEHGGNECWC